MAVKKVTVIECDRCHTDVDEEQFKAEGGRIQVQPTVRARGKSANFKVWDLCPSCRFKFETFLEGA